MPLRFEGSIQLQVIHVSALNLAITIQLSSEGRLLPPDIVKGLQNSRCRIQHDRPATVLP